MDRQQFYCLFFPNHFDYLTVPLGPLTILYDQDVLLHTERVDRNVLVHTFTVYLNSNTVHLDPFSVPLCTVQSKRLMYALFFNSRKTANVSLLYVYTDSFYNYVREKHICILLNSAGLLYVLFLHNKDTVHISPMSVNLITVHHSLTVVNLFNARTIHDTVGCPTRQ